MTIPVTSQTSGSTTSRRVVGIILVGLIGLCLLFVVGYVQRLAERDAAVQEMAELQQQIAEAQVRNAILTNELAHVNDDAHIAAVARDSLNLVQEGDQLLTLIDAPAPPAVSAGGPVPVRAPVNTEPNWQRWFDLVFGGN